MAKNVLYINDGRITETGLTPEDITIGTIGSPTIDDFGGLLLYQFSCGILDGGAFTDNGNGTVKVGAGKGLIRAANSVTSPILSVEWGDSNVTLTDNAVNYIFLQYNSGSPTFAALASPSADHKSNIYFGTVFREGTTLHMSSPSRDVIANIPHAVLERWNSTDFFARESGGVISAGTGTRTLAVSEGTWWAGVNKFTTSAFDSGVAGTFELYYRNGSGGWTETDETAINNTQYDDGDGTLATLTAGRYGVFWVYISMDGDVLVQFGQGDYTLAQAQAASVPAPPSHFASHARLIGKIIIQKSASSFYSIQSTFDTILSYSSVSDHGVLSGLTDDDHTQYLLADTVRNVSGTDVSSGVKNTTGIMRFFVESVGDTSATLVLINTTPGATTTNSINMQRGNLSAYNVLLQQNTDNTFTIKNEGEGLLISTAGVLSVTKSSYESSVTTDNIIPNRKYITDNFQPLDTQLTDIAGLTPTKGNLIAGNGTNFVALGVGSNNQALIADDTTATGVKWATAGAGVAALDDLNDVVIAGSPSDPEKGELLVYNGTNWVNIGVGTNTHVLTADSAQTNGIKWAAYDIVGDTTPQLGGNLDVNGNDIVSVSNGNIDIIPNGTGKTNITNLEAPMAMNNQTGTTYAPVLADADKMITLSNTSAITVTIPANSSVAFPVGTKLNFLQLNTGQVTIAITTDTLSYDASLTNKLNGRYAVATALKITSTSWVLFGNLEPA